MIYLTEDDYMQAEQNGISRRVAYQRFYHYDWSKERSITEPLRKMDQERLKWRAIAVENGVAKKLFDARLRAGWSYEEASRPPLSRLESIQRALGSEANKARSVLTRAQRQIAKANGIAYSTVTSRLSKKWSIERAITQPVDATKSKAARERSNQWRSGERNTVQPS